METWFQRIFLSLAVIVASPQLLAQDDETNTRGTPSVLDRIITPDLERRVIEEDILDSENFEVGFFAGGIGIEDFGTNGVNGIRFAYHINEDLFVEASVGESDLDKTSFERISGSAPLLTDDQRDLLYYDLVLGYNIFPGEIFVTDKWAFNSSFYLLAGAGNTSFGDEDNFTIVLGGGLRLFLTDWLAFHADVRERFFSTDILGEDRDTQNIEIHGGLTLFF